MASQPRLAPDRAAPLTAQDLLRLLPPDWLEIRTQHELPGGISIGCLDGRPQSDWAASGAAESSVGVAIVLDGQFGLGFEGGAALRVQPGSVILHGTAEPVPGWDEFKGRRAIRAVDIRFSSDAVRALWWRTLRQVPSAAFAADGSVPARDAQLAMLPLWPGLARVASEILAWNQDRGEIAALYLQGKAQEALALTLAHLAGRGAADLPPPADRKRLAEAHRRIQRDYADCGSVRQLAQAVGLSEKRLQAGFMSLYGQSVHGCLLQARMDAAARLLRRGCSVTETAYSIGFSSLSHFIKAFKAHRGATPTAWLRGAAQ
ncbi:MULTISPECIES: helix-turn-helix transcriptional regulator [Achromobacter]|uniref:AraC family transcriptional regulator n=2 Tax=Achromobacter TaxID=222 RepID=A0A0X8P315_ALCXX|nr:MULTISPECIES: AraC family transcriptional regulator [Achromobacter]AMG38854.1 AraC family transcriptional regulator [Achromobacter xylosoxidans]EGP47728.1 AraC family transcription regulator protein [Achromobacter insuavis AXX-A]